MLFGRRKPGYTTTVDSSVDPEQAVLDLQKAELAAKKKPKAEVFDINAASETARRLKETGSSFDGSAAKTGEDVIAAVERETAELAAMQAAGAAPEAAETVQDEAAKPQLLDFLAGEPEAENDPFADQPTKTAPELPQLTPAQELAGYIRARSAAALITPHALLLEEVENADELLAQMTRLCARQIFGVQVENDPWNAPWLSETPASCVELMAYRRREGEAAYEKRFYGEIEIATRLTRPRGVTIGASTEHFGGDGEMTQVLRDAGAANLMGIEQAVGQEAFIRALQTYIAENAGGIGSLEALESALERETGSDWSGYLADMLAS